MSAGIIALIVLFLAAAGYWVGRSRALSLRDNDGAKLHSLPSYYGQSVAMLTAIPALALMIVWLLVQPMVVESRASALITAADVPDGGSVTLVLVDVRRIAAGLDLAITQGLLTEQALSTMRSDLTDVRSRLGDVGVAIGSNVSAAMLDAARVYRNASATGSLAMTVVVFAAVAAGLFVSLRRINPDLRARNIVEQGVRYVLIACSLVAVLTTAGIVLSLLTETYRFFGMYSFGDFFFSLTWNPQFRGGSDLGIWPLIWGTLYVSFIALLFAVPVGLMSAIYLAEYASKPVRAVAKPLLEILAGIPTIVYGLFALITVGPLLRDYFAQPLGLGTSSSSVMTAGLVMGIMLIPFVSSLSDDIINAVPQSLRDGSYGLGATQSETTRQVILPAALPGIVGAVLLAASRAIGETMIVVMGAGAAAKLSLNPFEAMTTVTVKIVSQLTGDTEFASPETLVAFALGLTLFVFTLGLNVLALYIVRKYREQYE